MISHHHRALFVHIPKTGGQSVEMAFLDDLGLSFEQRAPLLLRANDDRSKGPMRLAHLFASEYVEKGYIDQQSFDSYLKFAVVRHPYTRALSEYRYRNDWREGPLWYFLRRDLSDEYDDKIRHMLPQWRYIYDDDGNCLVDRVIRFENLAEEMPPILKELIGPEATLPRRNTSPPSSSLFWPARLTRLHKRQIYNRYRRDFELFGYDPEL